MNFAHKWAVSAGVVGFPAVYIAAAAQQETNWLGEMPPLAACIAAVVMIGFFSACLWAVADRG